MSSNALYAIAMVVAALFVGFAVHDCDRIGTECIHAGKEWQAGNCMKPKP